MLCNPRLVFAGLVILGSAAWAQSVISAHSGTVHYVEGRVLLNDKQIDPKFGEFPNIKDGQVLTTQEGRAEVLLNPGVFLRVGEDSSIRMISNRLADTRLELLAGRAVLEIAELVPGNAVAMVVNGKVVSLEKKGLLELTATPPLVRVFQGDAIVTADGSRTTVRHGKEATLEAVVTTAKFNDRLTDDLYRWSSRRSGYIATANASSASYAGSSGGSGYYYGMSPGFGFGSAMGSWAWNPGFGMFTYMPMGDLLYSPFGYSYWSPYGFYSAYPYYGYYGYPGYPATGGSSSGRVSSGHSVPPVPSPYRGHASAAVVSRGSGAVSGGRTGGYSSASSGGYSRSGGYASSSPAAISPSTAGSPGGFSGGGMRGGGGRGR